MKKKAKTILDDSSRNPFDDYNANVLSPDLIMQYWCPPFNTGALPDLDEKEFLCGKMPIIIQGARGTGKTTILKYYSYMVRSKIAKEKGRTILEQIKEDGGVGFYLRCDEVFLDIFKTVFQACAKDRWEIFFKHYLELFFSKNIIKLIEEIQLNSSVSEKKLVEDMHLTEINEKFTFQSIKDIDDYLSGEMRYVLRYKNDAIYLNSVFSPKCLLNFYEMSKRFIHSMKQNILGMEKVLFLLFIDEFEALPFDLQIMFNSLIKYCNEGMSIRVGRRSEKENVISNETVNKEEYLQENSDYRLIRMNFHDVNKTKRKNYLTNIANKRLELYFKTTGVTLSDVIGEAEDLDWECGYVSGEKTRHLHSILKQNPNLTRNVSDRIEIIRTILRKDRVIGTALCALWVARNKEANPIEYAQTAADAMDAYFEKKEHPLREKFKNDYINKYRYAITVFICSVYKKDKMYYGFNTISYLTEGNARILINLMKTMISDAQFYEHDEFVEHHKISRFSQNRAVREFAITHFNSTCSIIHNGYEVRQLLQGIGNVLSSYHKDPQIRYPETTQFYYSLEQMDKRNKKVIETAESWVLLNRDAKQHRMSASIGQQGNLYSLNRIFCPIFNISYRTRGGVNVMFSDEDIRALIAGKEIVKLSNGTKLSKDKKTNIGPAFNVQISLFDGEN